MYQRDKQDNTWKQKNESDEFISPASNFILFVINMLLFKTKKYPDSVNTLVSLIQALLKNNMDMKKFIVHARFLGRVGYYLFNSEYIKNKYSSITEPFPVNENESFIQLNKDVEFIPTNNFQDFENPLSADFQKLFQLFWQLLRYCRIEGRDNYSKFLYHDSSFDYVLREAELKALQLSSSRIKKMFDHVDRNDRKAKRTICKIVAFFSYGSLEDSQSSFEFIKQGFSTAKDTEDVFQMIQILCKVNDHFQIDRVYFHYFSNLCVESNFAS